MKKIQFMAAGVALMSASAGFGQTSDQTRDVPARLIHSGYAKKNGNFVYGPEGTDKVWAEWVYRSCIKKEVGKKYIFHQLVHSVRFGKPEGIYLLTVGQNDTVRRVSRARHGPGRC